MSTVLSNIREYFLLSDAAATAKATPEDVRARIARELAVGRQRAEAADALWSNGHTAEGLRLSVSAFQATLEAAETLRWTGSESPQRPIADAAQPAIAPALPVEEPVADALSSNEPADEPAPDVEASADPEPEPPSDLEHGADEAAAEAEAEEAHEPPREPETALPLDADRGDDDLLLGALPAHRDLDRDLGRSEARTAEGGPIRGLALSGAKLDEVRQAERAAREVSLPALDADVSTDHGELFQQLLRARRHIHQSIEPASKTPRELTYTRVSRIAFAVAVLGLAVVVAVLASRTPEGIVPTASGEFAADYRAENAIDSNVSTEWLLPNGTGGSLDVTINPPQAIQQIRIRNAHNRGFNDRATRAYSIEVYENGDVVRTIESEFEELDPSPSFVAHEVGADAVDRIRLNVHSWHQTGAGIAELDWN